MKWSALSPRERRAVFLGALVLGAAFLVRLGVLPYLHALDEAQMDLDRQTVLLEREQALLRGAASYPRIFREQGAEFLSGAPQLLEGGTPAVIQASLARRVESAALGAPALLIRLEPLPTRPVGVGFVALPLRVEGESDLEGLLSLLATLEGGPHLFHVEELEIEAHSSGTGGLGGGVEPREVLAFHFTVTGFGLAEEARNPALHRATPIPPQPESES